MKNLKGILAIMAFILLALAFTVPSKEDFESHIVEKVKAETHNDAFGLNDLLIQNISKIVFLNAEYQNVKVGSTYSFNLGEDKEYKFVGFGTMIICVEGDLSILNKDK